MSVTKFERLRKVHKPRKVTLTFDVYAPEYWTEDQVRYFAISLWGGLKEEQLQKMFGTCENDEATMVMV